MAYGLDTARNQILGYLEQVQSEIIELAVNQNRVASGKTLQSLEVIPSNTGGALWAAEHIIFLETGRPPTHTNTAGDPTLIEIIKQWISDKGLDLNPYAVAKTIHKEGTKLYRQGGKSGVLSIPLAAAGLNTLFYDIATQFSQTVFSDIYEPVNELQNTI